MNPMVETSVAPFYDRWRLVNEHLIETVNALTPEQLQLRPAPNLWPIWATVAHVAGTRVYWLCLVLKEPGAERTGLVDPSGQGWEDDLTHPRGSRELATALESSWGIVEGCLARWTPEMLEVEFRREMPPNVQMHTRQSVLMRLITHESYHYGEISLTLGMHGLEGAYLWAGFARLLPL
jgi:uncharacterized damage-inducible protein DinB